MMPGITALHDLSWGIFECGRTTDQGKLIDFIGHFRHNGRLAHQGLDGKGGRLFDLGVALIRAKDGAVCSD